MKDHSANSYDLQDAKQMLDLLLGKQQGAVSGNELRPDAVRYLDLSSSEFSRQLHSEKTVSAVIDEEIDTSLRTFDSWENILTWCISASKSEAGFVVDSQGFVIASRGRLPSHGIEGVGAELVCSIDQLERIDPEAGRLSCVEIEFDRKRLIGFVAVPDEKNCFVIGLIAPDILPPQVKQGIIKQILHNLPNLD
jgi:hypothetical protein